MLETTRIDSSIGSRILDPRAQLCCILAIMDSWIGWLAGGWPGWAILVLLEQHDLSVVCLEQVWALCDDTLQKSSDDTLQKSSTDPDSSHCWASLCFRSGNCKLIKIDKFVRTVCQCAPETTDPDAESAPRSQQIVLLSLCATEKPGLLSRTNMWKECKISPKLTEDSLHVCIYCCVGDLHPRHRAAAAWGRGSSGRVSQNVAESARQAIRVTSESSFRESAMLGRTGRKATDQSEPDMIYPLELISDR